MELYMMMGNNWSGWLRIYPGGKTVFELRSVGNLLVFKQKSFPHDYDCAQWMDHINIDKWVKGFTE